MAEMIINKTIDADNTIMFTVSGDLSIDNSQQFKDELLQCEKSQKISIHLSDVNNIDVAFVQIILSLKAEMPVECRAELPAELDDLLQKSGLKKLLM